MKNKKLRIPVLGMVFVAIVMIVAFFIPYNKNWIGESGQKESVSLFKTAFRCFENGSADGILCGVIVGLVLADALLVFIFAFSKKPGVILVLDAILLVLCIFMRYMVLGNQMFSDIQSKEGFLSRSIFGKNYFDAIYYPSIFVILVFDIWLWIVLKKKKY